MITEKELTPTEAADALLLATRPSRKADMGEVTELHSLVRGHARELEAAREKLKAIETESETALEE